MADLLTAFALICSLSTPREDCNYATARLVLQVPPKDDAPMTMPVSCALYAQEWLGRQVIEGNVKITDREWVKVFCVPPQKLPGHVG